MCQMFCGWRLTGSKPNLVDLGSGTLEIDAITAQCSFQGKSIRQLTIAEEIRAWMHDDLATHNIPLKALTSAHLSVKLSFSVVPWSASKTEIFYSGGKAVRTEKMNRCVIECHSQVSTDKVVYRSNHTEIQNWPIDWPDTGNPEIWIGVVEVSYIDSDKPDIRKNAFTVVTTWARNSDEFSAKCKRMLESYGWNLLGVETSNPASPDHNYSDEVAEMLERTRVNPNAIIYGTFNNYPVM
jgi:hypothetical protein